ncbi:isochorismate synthase, partial [Thiolapillus sp.]
MARPADNAPALPLWLGRLHLELRQLALPVLRSSRRGLLSISLEAPLDLPEAPPAGVGRWLYWHRPEAAHCLLGLGLAWKQKAGGGRRFDELDAGWQALQGRWTRITQGRARPGARAFLGFAFDPGFQPGEHWQGFDNALIQVPRLLAEWRGGRCGLSFNGNLDEETGPEQLLARWKQDLERLLAPRVEEAVTGSCSLTEEPASDRWREAVARAVAAAGRGRLDKVVLSRRLQLHFNGPVPHRALMPGLARHYPGCTLLSLCLGGDVLLAATPERLLSMNGPDVQCDALAGTFPVGSRDSHADMATHEHAPVVAAIREALQPFCGSLRVDETPGRMPLNNLAHLYTAIHGRARQGVRPLQLAARLHPTPAVGGMPRQAALDWMGRRERLQRGWYTGAFGWLGDNRQADLSVLLRCARIAGNRATLYASAGINRVSYPARELRETELKFEPLLHA